MNIPYWLKAFTLSLALLPATAGFSTSLLPTPSGDELNLDDRGGRHGKGNPEVRAYLRQNVMPVVRQQRQKLEAQLSAADKTELAGYRAELKALREKGKTLRQSLRSADAPQGQRPELTDAQKQQVEQLRTARRAIMENVAKLAQKYDAQIKQLAEEVKPQREKWAADLLALRHKNATPEQQRWQQRHSHHQAAEGKHHKFFGPARFLLMDPNAPAKIDGNDTSGGRAALYPNPTSGSQRLEYEVRKDGNVKVELLDERGKSLRTVFDGKQDKGSHSLDMNVADLNRGTYLYKITSKGGSETRRFVKE